MHLFLFLPYYARWHYSRGFRDLFRNWIFIVSFVFSFFSISFLIKSLFAPWQRLNENYKKGFDPEAFFSTLLVNGIMRVVGFLTRFVVIILGLISTALSFFGGLLVLFLWAIFPLLIAFLLALCIKEFF